VLSVTAAVAVLATLASKYRDACGTKGFAPGGATWTVGLGTRWLAPSGKP
jgi:hypothetical protein